MRVCKGAGRVRDLKRVRSRNQRSVLAPFILTLFLFPFKGSPARLTASSHLYTDDHKFLALV